MRNSTFIILLAAIILASFGVSSIYSSTSQKEGRPWQEATQRQLLWISIGLFIFFVSSRINYRILWDWTYVLYGLMLFFLFLVVVLGVARLGAQRWLRIAWFNFQPSELAKLIMVIFLARYFSTKSFQDISLQPRSLGILRGFILPFIFVLIPLGLIVEQPDLGSALMLLFLFVAIVFLTGVKLRYLVIFTALMFLLFPLFWHLLRDYQKERLLVFLNPNIDPLGAGYTILQSKIAIGSSGLLGKGWLSGTQSQLRFLPEAHTDFIFATFAEERGFIGSAIVIFLYYILVRQGLSIAGRTHDHFGKLMALGISFMLGIQVTVNIAMTLGLAPVVGLPLPLMSYGGSSVVVTFIALGILVSIDRRRAVF